MDQAQTQSLGAALSILLAALGVSPVVGQVINGLLALATVGPELYAMVQQDIQLLQDGKITVDDLAARFATTQATFEKLAVRWKAAPAES